METPTDAETGITLDVSLENETETLDDDTFEEKLRGQECEDLTKNKNPGYDEFGQRSVELLKELHMPSMALIFQCDAGNGENTGKRQCVACPYNTVQTLKSARRGKRVYKNLTRFCARVECAQRRPCERSLNL
ncbi:hypothetical protein SK128_028035, partial [Halocaridina rubra]